jgi:Cache 3/Cache 2 fusion domain/Protein of unknown function (DUF4239)
VFYWIYDYPNSLIGILFGSVFVVATWLAMALFRRYCRQWFHSERRANDMVGFALSSFSVLYGILVGLIAVAAYQNFCNVSDVVTKEASSLGALYGDLSGYPQPIRNRLLSGLRDYTRFEIDRDWKQLQRGIVPSEGTHRLQVFIDDLLSFKPADRSEEIVHAETLHQLNELLNFRRARLESATVGIPAVLWWVVGIGALICVLLIAMLEMEIHVHLILGGALSLFLGLVIFLIAAMDNPLRGEVSVQPEALATVYTTLMQPSDAVNRSMAALISETGKLGPPRLEGREAVAGKDVPALYFGTTKMNNSFDVVDEVVKETGGTASLFVKSGNEYVRVATNVPKRDGSRAMGTVLDPKGPAIAKIRRGEAFYGEATILDKPYVTGYEPIKDPAGNVIGIYYTGYIKP